MIRGNPATVAVALVLVALFVLALLLARAQGHLPLLALDLSEHLFGIVLAVFVFERMLAWREERRWLSAKNWLYMILLESIDDLLKELLPPTRPLAEGAHSQAQQISVLYEVSAKRIHFGEAVAYNPLKLLVGPHEKDLQSHILWYAGELGAPQYAQRAREALAETREQIREMFGSSARLMDAEITAMLMSFEQAALAAIKHLESAERMRKQKELEGGASEGGEGDSEDSSSAAGRRRVREADDALAFASSIIVESVVASAIKPKGWLEDRMHILEGRSSPFSSYLLGGRQGGSRGAMGSRKRT